MNMDAAVRGLQVYMVGGAVRDYLLGLSIGDRDWVVVGTTPEDMIERGFIPVGDNFPVFHHPFTREEYALARTERKVARGYKGFHFYTGPEVSLEDDLNRRDLTINAIAQAPDGQLIDPYGGSKDIKNRVLRHVSAAFSEDPVRILRLARFASRFSNFVVAAETMKLCCKMVQNGETDALVAERVWKEFSRGLMTQYPSRMLEVLANSQALTRILPELIENFTTRIELDRAAERKISLPGRYAVLCRHTKQCHLLNKRLRVSKDCADYARLLPEMLSALEEPLRPLTQLALIERCDAMRKPQRFFELLEVIGTLKEVDLSAWQQRIQVLQSINGAAIAEACAGNPAQIKLALHNKRLNLLSMHQALAIHNVDTFK